MKKVTLLGDSIRYIGYGLKVPELLKDEFEVYQPNENCRFALYTYALLHQIRKPMEDCDIVYWNNGIWDIADCYGEGPFTPIDEYVKIMVKIAKILKERAKIVIFATTTPIVEGVLSYGVNTIKDNSIIREYNKAVVPELEKMGIIISDLYSFVEPNMDEYICEDKCHLSQKGIDKVSEEVARVIRECAKKL